MKNKKAITISLGLFLSLSCLSAAIGASLSKKTAVAEALTIPTTVSLKDNDEDEIRDYYSYLNNLPDSERRGQNLLKNLKYILVNNPSNPSKPAQYFTYNQVRSIYRITDRNWYSSPASGISGYNSTTKTITDFNYNEDPYLYYYYRDDNFTNPHRATATIYSKAGSSQTLLNQEHIWSKSHGFSEGNGVPNAGSDLHHLVAADVAVNKWGHSEECYGYVETEDSWASTKADWDNGANAILNNKRGTIKNPSSSDTDQTVFEPRDQDKGDFARALLYMVARYNYIGDSSSAHSVEEPNLELVDYVLNEKINCSTSSDVCRYGKLSDILDWHKVDPVVTGSNQDFEVHRNNLIYNNYQYTRNPFIDFPGWVDLIWGDKKDTGVARPETDKIYGYNSNDPVSGVSLDKQNLTVGVNATATLTETVAPSTAGNKNVTWSTSNGNIATVTNGVVRGVANGSCTITVTTVDGGYTATCNVTVQANAPTVSSVALNKASDSIDLKDGSTISLTATVNGTNNPPQTVTWTSNNNSVATVSNGTVTCLKSGTATITATSTFDTTIKATCTIVVTDTRQVETYTVDVIHTDYEDAYESSSGTITKTVDSQNDLTLQYSGIKTKSSSTSDAYGYKYAMYLSGEGYIYADSAPSGYYPSAISVTFGGSSSTKGKIDAFFSKEKITTIQSPTTTVVKENGYSAENNDSEKIYWNLSTSSYNVQIKTITITYSLIGTTPEEEPVDVTGVSLDTNSATLEIGDTLQLNATVAPENADDQTILWSSDDSDVAEVDVDGLVTAKAAGNAAITVETVDGGFTATCDITVNSPDAPAVNSVTVAPSALSLNLTTQTTGNLTATVDVSNGAPTTVTWTSSNSNVATVSSSGVVTAQGGGNCVITATSTYDGTKSGTCNVTVSGATPSNKYTLADDISDIVPGATIVFIGLHTAGTVIMGAEQESGTGANKAYSRVRTNVSVTNNQISDVSAGVTFTVGLNQHGYYFQDNSTNKYLDASKTTVDKHNLYSVSSLDDETLNTYWDVSYSAGTWHVFSKSVNTEEIRYLKNDSTGRFSCYNSGKQSPIALYVLNKELVSNQSRIDAFSYLYMRKGETLSDEDTGACKGENGYFNKARTALATATASGGWATVATIFGSDTSGMWKRYCDWGKACGVNVSFSNNTIAYNSIRFNPVFNNENSTETALIAVFVAVLISMTTGAYIVIRKKKKGQ